MRLVYRIICIPTQQSYVGETGNYKTRKNKHLIDLYHGIHSSPKLQHAYNEYGKDAFTFEVIENDIPDDQSENREAYWIQFFNCIDNGFNYWINRSKRIGKKCVWAGIEYRSIKEASETTGIEYWTMLENVYKGKSG